MPGRESLAARVLRIEGLPINVVMLILVALFMLFAPEVFLSYRIYMTFLVGLSPLLVLAAGLTLLIAAGEIDLSFPSIIALSGWVLAYCIHEFQAPWLGLVLALGAGTFVGWFNGILVARVAFRRSSQRWRPSSSGVGSPPCSRRACPIRSAMSKSCLCGRCSSGESARSRCNACGPSA